MPKPVIIKIGGSLVKQENGKILSKLGKILGDYASKHPILIVPGGGPFADTVRDYGEKLNLSDLTCHFMALLAMDQVAFLLKEFIPGSRLTDLSDPTSLFQIHSHPVPQILLCSRYISLIPAEDLPRSWDVTSDSISAFLAKKLDAALLVLLKSTDIGPEVKEPDVDGYFCKILSPAQPVWFLNGLYPERLAELFEFGETYGLRLGQQGDAY
ncbi:MAG: hypothetical protein P4L69_23230 [Desulfosporosinus sp.]|nr:hypothetical protein [Desulfosporosinus sp.]